MANFEEFIEVKGAREHNLKNIDVSIPREKLVVITGLSGSGKSSLAFDTIYAEGQRRYIETFSAYARQFLGGLSGQMLIKLMACPLLFLLNKKQQANRHALPWEPLPRFTIFYVYFLLVPVMLTALTRATRW